MSKKPSLFELQSWMKWRLTRSEDVPPFPDGQKLIADQPPLPRDERLDIYADAYIARIVEVLSEDFSTIAHLLGENDFYGLVQGYMKHFPSKSATVTDLGQSFASFLLLQGISDARPYLFELATFEWALCEALYTDVGEKMDFSKLGEIPESVWSQGRIQFNPSVRFFRFDWPVQKMWARQNVEKPQTTYLMIFRGESAAHFEELTPNEFKMLRLLQNGYTIEAALDEASEHDPSTLNQNFSKWMSWGLFSSFDFSVIGCD